MYLMHGMLRGSLVEFVGSLMHRWVLSPCTGSGIKASALKASIIGRQQIIDRMPDTATVLF